MYVSHLTPWTPTKPNIYLASFLTAAVNELDLHNSLHSIYQTKCHFSFAYVVPKEQSRPEAHVYTFRNKASF